MLLPSLSVFLSYVIIIFFRTITNIINITISIISNISNITANATPKVSLGLQPFLIRAFNPPGARQQSPDLPTRKGSICSSNLQPEHFYFSTETSPTSAASRDPRLRREVLQAWSGVLASCQRRASGKTGILPWRRLSAIVHRWTLSSLLFSASFCVFLVKV